MTFAGINHHQVSQFLRGSQCGNVNGQILACLGVTSAEVAPRTGGDVGSAQHYFGGGVRGAGKTSGKIATATSDGSTRSSPLQRVFLQLTELFMYNNQIEN